MFFNVDQPFNIVFRTRNKWFGRYSGFDKLRLEPLLTTLHPVKSRFDVYSGYDKPSIQICICLQIRIKNNLDGFSFNQIQTEPFELRV